jgi:putative DNA primase/helicase
VKLRAVVDTWPSVGETGLTDIGNGQRLAMLHGRDLRFLPAASCWLVWDGNRWRRDELREVDRRAKATALSIFEEARAMSDGEARTALYRHAISSQSDPRIRAMLKRAEAEEGVALRHSALDTDPWLLNVANGTLDLRTKTLRPHRREDFITRLAPVAYDARAQCPRWERFLSEIMAGDRDVIGYVQRAVGYSLTGDTREECFFCCYGRGSNGKTKQLETLRALSGDYAAQANFDTFLEQRSDRPRPDIARLAGRRIVTAVEVGENARLSESVIKSVTGGDTVTARQLYERDFEFRPQFKLWLAANHKPIIRATDHAMWRRVHLIPFDVSFEGSARDDQLAAKLLAELPGILRWAVDGCQAWLEQGLCPPERVVAATAAYKIESDTLGAFLDECCTVDTTNPRTRTPAAELYTAYRRWVDVSGEHAISNTLFGRRLNERGILAEKAQKGRRYRVGIALDPDWQKREGSEDTDDVEGMEGREGLRKTSYTRAHIGTFSENSRNPPEPSTTALAAAHNNGIPL